MQLMILDTAHPVVVLSHGSGINALSIVRSLGRRGIAAHLLALRASDNLAAMSRYCSTVSLLEAESTNDMNQALTALLSSIGVRPEPVLMCDSDESLHLASSCDPEILRNFIAPCPLERFTKLQNKKFQVDTAAQAGIATPRSWYPNDWKEFAAIAPSPGRRLIVKPNPSVFVTSAPFKIFHAADALDAESKLRQFVSTPTGMIIQEFIEGSDLQMWAVVGYRPPGARPMAMVAISKVKQSGRGAGGVGIICKTHDVPVLEKATAKLLEALNYHGPFAVEFKYCAAQNEFVFIEANYRTARINVIGRRVGGDVPTIMYASLTGQDASIVTSRVLNHPVWYYDMRGCRQTLPRTLDFKVAISMVGHMLMAPCRRTEWAVHAWDDMKPSASAWRSGAGGVADTVERGIKRLLGFEGKTSIDI